MSVLAITTTEAILLGVLGGFAAVVLIVGFAATARRPRRRRGPDIPPSMRPGPSDPDLERPVLERLLAMAAILVVFLAIWVPVYFLREPVSNENDTRAMAAASIERGKLTTEPGTEQNQLGFNCERCHGPNLHGGQNIYNGNIVVVPNLQTVCGGAKLGHPLIHGLQDIVNTIAEGRPGTDMPSWSVRFSGAMDDQQINDLVNYIISIQKVPFADNLCTNPQAASAAATPAPAPSASATPAPTPSASKSP